MQRVDSIIMVHFFFQETLSSFISSQFRHIVGNWKCPFSRNRKLSTYYSQVSFWYELVFRQYMLPVSLIQWNLPPLQ